MEGRNDRKADRDDRMAAKWVDGRDEGLGAGSGEEGDKSRIGKHRTCSTSV